MTGPPSYPRTPHLWPDTAHPRRLVVPPEEVEGWLRSPVIVEEKVDGANVSLWWAEGAVQVATRGGPDAMDRAGQLGRLRAWSAERSDGLESLLADSCVLYGEWLWLRHGVGYDALPDWLIALDLWHPIRGFIDTAERDTRCAAAGLVLPPRLFTGVLRDRESVDRLMERSVWASGRPPEGIVIRDQGGRRCKVVRDDYVRRDDAAWMRRSEHNRLSTKPPMRSGRGRTGEQEIP